MLSVSISAADICRYQQTMGVQVLGLMRTGCLSFCV
jgi:hypothetical protein